MTEPGGSPPSSRQFRTAEGGAVPVLSAGRNAGRMRGNAGRDFDFDFSKKARKLPGLFAEHAGDETAAQSGGSASRAAAGCGELKAGWLHKYSIRSAFAKNWKKRWFIVGRDHISYFEKNPETYTGKSQAIAKGAVALQGATLLPDVPGKRAFMFQLTYQPSAAASETVMVLAADSDAERQQWVGAIETALANA